MRTLGSRCQCCRTLVLAEGILLPRYGGRTLFEGQNGLESTVRRVVRRDIVILTLVIYIIVHAPQSTITRTRSTQL